MTNENDALRQSDDAIKRIEALEKQLERALGRIYTLGEIAWRLSADIDELAVSLGEPSP